MDNKFTDIHTQDFKFNDGWGKIHAISTGTVSVKEAFRSTKKNQWTSKLEFILQNKFTAPLPIWVWVIEHPEGKFVIDTGENSKVSEPDYFSQEGILKEWINKNQFKFNVNKDRELHNLLPKLNIEIDHIDQVLLTHLHLDHIDGLKFFSNQKVLLNKEEWEKPSFALKSLLPENFNPSLFETNESHLDFKNTKSITKARDLHFIHTPGHTFGHCSILASNDRHDHIFFGGDMTYTSDQLKYSEMSGGHIDFKKAQNTIKTVSEFCKANKAIFLPSHDPYAGLRLQERNYFS
ncbi:MBL fold metallo-hydrolase [Aureibacter tunicatorum]|uniref:Glyoxylase-like metal-dependent hydrolase (Beta-lactamase superfamily II) n=1 Tax=Aureibacter tunicatorum TaxID=866807 RepID=A0AAE4BR51_9BACT|nr:MBL fold metallo-hydrolase [Aureibacter tunicatorum]MDR6238301.1 glyoxylase-like metal-dependent hydrolase (beta-lactamase superfamily II) [Aureibacter tunicatorum]BDD03333.1 N-acyl homoserine lactonase family protein [Aureibacter tunicatorum]